MAIRRMFSKQIINSARFIKMPTSSQLLYFHLSLNADDDGVVEGYNVMRMINCTEDDLHILVAKSFVIVMNEDLVTYITDWTEHNLIRPDRKVDSIYKNLLIKIIADRCPTNDRQLTDNGQHRVGKVSLGEVSIDNIAPKEIEDCSYINKKEMESDVIEIRKLYQGVKRKANADLKIPALLKKYSKEELIRGIERYNKYVKAERKTGFNLKFQIESTYWNGGYMDYLDKNFLTEAPIRKKIVIDEGGFL